MFHVRLQGLLSHLFIVGGLGLCLVAGACQSVATDDQFAAAANAEAGDVVRSTWMTLVAGETDASENDPHRGMPAVIHSARSVDPEAIQAGQYPGPSDTPPPVPEYKECSCEPSVILGPDPSDPDMTFALTEIDLIEDTCQNSCFGYCVYGGWVYILTPDFGFQWYWVETAPVDCQ